MMVSQNLDSSGSSSRMEEEISGEEDTPMLSQEKDYSRRMEREDRFSSVPAGWKFHKHKEVRGALE